MKIVTNPSLFVDDEHTFFDTWFLSSLVWSCWGWWRILHVWNCHLTLIVLANLEVSWSVRVDGCRFKVIWTTKMHLKLSNFYRQKFLLPRSNPTRVRPNLAKFTMNQNWIKTDQSDWIQPCPTKSDRIQPSPTKSGSFWEGTLNSKMAHVCVYRRCIQKC